MVFLHKTEVYYLLKARKIGDVLSLGLQKCAYDITMSEREHLLSKAHGATQ
jgi:hypothetical protein